MAETDTKQPVQILAHEVKLKEHARQDFHVDAPFEHTLEDVLGAHYLFHKHETMQVGNTCAIRHKGGKFYVELLVMAIDKETRSVQCHPIVGPFDFSKKALPKVDLARAEVVAKPRNKWAIEADGQTLKAGFDTEEAAASWLQNKRAA